MRAGGPLCLGALPAVDVGQARAEIERGVEGGTGTDRLPTCFDTIQPLPDIREPQVAQHVEGRHHGEIGDGQIGPGDEGGGTERGLQPNNRSKAAMAFELEASRCDLMHRIAFELVALIACPHVGLLASKLGCKASTNLGAPHIGLKASAYGTHSMRRTKVTPIYKKTGNLRMVQLLLGLTKMDITVRYLGVELEDALAIAESIEI